MDMNWDDHRYFLAIARERSLTAAGRALGVSGTPALFINGRFLSGAQPYDVIARVIDDELQRGGA